jgi:hypothetical protein
MDNVDCLRSYILIFLSDFVIAHCSKAHTVDRKDHKPRKAHTVDRKDYKPRKADTVERKDYNWQEQEHS